MSGQVYREVMMGKIIKKMKWIFGICLAVVVCLGVNNVMAEETEIDTSVFEYEENEDGTITITYCNSADETVVVPSQIDAKNVSCISGYAFDRCDAIKQLIISEGIINLLEDGSGTCKDRENLESVSLPSTLQTIGESAFSGCIKLSEINLPEGLVSIGDWAFYKCVKLNNVVLPDGLINIGRSAFSNCCSIEKLTVPDSVTQIGERAFDLSYDSRIPIIYGNPDAYIKTYCDADHYLKFSCLNHPNIVIDPAVAPNCKYEGMTEGSHCSVCGMLVVEQQYIRPNGQHTWNDKIYGISFTAMKKVYNCTVCGKIKYEPFPSKGSIITDSNASYKVTTLSAKERTVEFVTTQGSESNIIIPNKVKIDKITYKVTSIAKNAFKNNKNLKKITISGNITKINANAFRGCSNLKTITIKSKNLSTVGKNAFKGISSKAKIKVPSNRLEKYKKLLTKKGQRSSVKITK
jgi:hypothetical protein